MKKYLLGTLLMLALIVGVGATNAYAFTSAEAEAIITVLHLNSSQAALIRSFAAKPAATANVTTYTNPTYKYSVSIPSGWKNVSFDNINKNIIFQSPDLTRKNYNPFDEYGSLEITQGGELTITTGYTSFKTLQELIQFNALGHGGRGKENQRIINVHGINAIAYDFVNNSMSFSDDGYGVAFVNNGISYEIDIVSKNINGKSILDSVVSSLVLKDSIQTSPSPSVSPTQSPAVSAGSPTITRVVMPGAKDLEITSGGRFQIQGSHFASAYLPQVVFVYNGKDFATVNEAADNSIWVTAPSDLKYNQNYQMYVVTNSGVSNYVNVYVSNNAVPSPDSSAVDSSFSLKVSRVTQITDPKTDVSLSWPQHSGAVKYSVYLRNSQSETWGGAIAGVGALNYTAEVNKYNNNYFLVQACSIQNCVSSNEVLVPAVTSPSPTPSPSPSNSPASTNNAPSVQVLQPNGGETYVVGKNMDIVWNNHLPAGSTIDSVSFALVGSSGAAFPITVQKLAMYSSGFNGNFLSNGASFYTYTVGSNIPAGEYRLRVTCKTCATEATDMSNGTFKIVSSSATPSITLSYPSTGNTIKAGSTINILWRGNNIRTNAIIDIALYPENNTSQGTFIALNNPSSTNDGTQTYTIPASITPGNYRLQISCRDCINDFGYNPYVWGNVFTIAPYQTPSLSPTVSPSNSPQASADSDTSDTAAVINFIMSYFRH